MIKTKKMMIKICLIQTINKIEDYQNKKFKYMNHLKIKPKYQIKYQIVHYA